MSVLFDKQIIALGFFDCVHMAHRKILETARQAALSMGVKSAAITFTGNIKTMPVVYDYDERVKLLSELCDNLISFEFSDDFKSMSAENFLMLLINKYNAVGFVCGYDYTFGKNAAGNSAFLSAFAKEHNFFCSIEVPLYCDGEPVSSTEIKHLLSEGNIVAANKLLVKPYHITQRVVHGRGQGHLFGFPTINFLPKNNVLLPKYGVYSTMSDINGKLYCSVTNIGNKPTFGDDVVSIETFVDGFSGSVYDSNVTIIFKDRLREIKKFDNASQLKQQIFEDIRRSKLCCE